MKKEIIPFAEWDNNLRLSNDHVEIVISLEVGPRILSYRTGEGENVLKMYQDQLGQANEDAFMIRGGHRLWAAPEDEKLTYHWDNEPVSLIENTDGSVTFVSNQKEPLKLKKELQLTLAESSSLVTIHHRITNESDEPVRLASWGLSVMAPGGMEIIPHPALGEHPLDLLPNRTLTLWPYTSMADERYTWGERFILLRQDDSLPATKIGLSLTEGWVAYLIENSLFIKTLDHEAGKDYPDFGCNFETFTNQEMIEIESLGPLTDLAPGQSTGHTETWHLFHLATEVNISSEEELYQWITPFLHEAGIR